MQLPACIRSSCVWHPTKLLRIAETTLPHSNSFSTRYTPSVSNLAEAPTYRGSGKVTGVLLDFVPVAHSVFFALVALNETP